VDLSLSDDQVKQIAKDRPSHIIIKVKAKGRKLYNHVNEKYEADRFTLRKAQFSFTNNPVSEKRY